MSGENQDSRARWARETIERVAPRGSRARAALITGRATAIDARSFASRTRWRWRWSRSPRATTPTYLEWLDRHRPTSAELAAERSRVGEASIQIGVHCLLLGCEDHDAVQRTLASLKRQTFPNWSATAVGGRLPLTAPRRIATVASEAEALAAAVQDGDAADFVVVLEAGDVAEPDFLFNIAARGWDDPAVDLVHWDDDLIDESGQAHDPRFRPSWSPDMLLSSNYLGRSFAVRRRRLAAAGGFGERGGDARWWELLLRLSLSEAQVSRVPRVLLHQARRSGVAADEGAAIVGEHLAATGQDAEVGLEQGAVRVRWSLPDPPSVSIVIPTRSRETLLKRCLEGLARTDYPKFGVLVVDSGDRDGAERWYADRDDPFPLEATWWEGPFNYSAANNLGARACGGEVLVFLNDDVEITQPDWLAELVGWSTRPGVGLAGLQLLDGNGLIQHGGVVVGMTGFGGHLFAGMKPGSDSLIGSTTWYRNCLSVTAACVAVERDLFDQIGGFDERFLLCGSDVVLGLDARFHGRRSVCSPFGGVRHLESETRGENVPPEDFFTSYWRYQTWLRGGDCYFSPSLSLQSPEPKLRGAEEPTAMETVGAVLGREFSVFRQQADSNESKMLAKQCRADRSLERRVREQHDADPDPIAVKTVNWFVPEIDSPFYGGINTAFRIAERLAVEHGVQNQFVVAAAPNERYIRSAIEAAFPSIADSKIAFSDGQAGPNLDSMPPADVSIATQWHTAYLAAHFPHTRRRFYLIQDFEPAFYPAGTNYALAEETYRLGLYGICNTERMRNLYRDRYDGEGSFFMPAIDGSIFHAKGRAWREEGEPVTIFTYARPGHWRNCWELASPALLELKRRLGQGVRIVTAGSWAHPNDLGRGIEHLGLLDYRDTGKLYRSCDLGLALTVSEHPSYLPLELLACGAPVVAFDNPAGDWIIQHEKNSLRCPRTVDGLVEGLERMATDTVLRRRLAQQGLEDIAARHSRWEPALAGIYPYLCDPGSATG
jgi:GT2 family glycosyltransferase/glycosyltransferase involved in cell wall biosynthesis